MLRSLTLGLLLCLPLVAAASDFALEQVAPGVYVHEGVNRVYAGEQGINGDIANLGLIVGESCAAVVDTGGSLVTGKAFAEAVRERAARPVCWIILTHGHPDHVFGTRAFMDGDAVVIGHEGLGKDMERMRNEYLQAFASVLGSTPGAALVPPQREIDGRLTLDLGGRQLELRAWPAAHTATDLTVYDGKTGTLFAGDLLFTDRIPVLDGSLGGWLDVLDAWDRWPPGLVRIVPGHGRVSAEPAVAVQAERDYLQQLRDAICRWIEDGGDLDAAPGQVQMDGEDRWELWARVQPLNLKSAFTELEWSCF